MPKEIEYKFTVASVEWEKDSSVKYYKQGYLSIEKGRTVRIRLEGDKAKLTIKGEKVGPEGAEFEYDIPLEDAQNILEKLCLKPLIEKSRYFVNYAGKLWEVDEFCGENSGLLLAEIELDNQTDIFEKPPWLGKDVTNDPKYKNANLVNYPFNRWSKEEKQNHYLNK
ncbi:MAG: adenylate cyclase [Ignavibacteria bacterium CG2_30_36_16]|nr:CYTH domain-containing protein [Ignavibacteria bacterium]OIP55132.1 MAG: adenylate cyclase [Ignavibacteria bacterium CG2_30_36_16]PJA98992.1 MAG: adenylate cyclase [Ignavibacteria bacterium CG_4_9_14_3_um_filter_36_18]